MGIEFTWVRQGGDEWRALVNTVMNIILHEIQVIM
jgi:hypothetical protein